MAQGNVGSKNKHKRKVKRHRHKKKRKLFKSLRSTRRRKNKK